MKFRVLMTILLIVLAVMLFGEDRVKQFKVEYFYIENSYENRDVKDFNGDLCSWLKVDYDADIDIVFSDAGIKKKLPDKDKREVDVYIEQWAKSITISAEGFLPYKYPFPENLQPGKCFVMGIRVPDWVNKGVVLVSPNPLDAIVSIVSEEGLRYENTGISRFEDLDEGYYEIVVEHEGCLTYKDKFSLGKGQELSISPVLIDTNLYFILDIEPSIFENLEIEVNKDADFNTKGKVEIYIYDKKIAIGIAGEYFYRLMKNGRVLYSDNISVFKDNPPEITLNYIQYSITDRDGEMYVDGNLYDSGKNLILVSGHNQENVRVSIKGFRSFNFTESFKGDSHQRDLIEGEDYFSTGFGIGLISNESKVFYGIKLPIILSADYYSMNGIELNIFSAGNKGKRETSGYFNGIGIAGFTMSAGKDLSGLAMSGICTSADGNLNGIAIGGLLTTAGGDMNGFSFGALNVVQGRAAGLQVGAVNIAKDLKGIQIGVINIIDDGKGGGIPVMPLINIKF